MSSTKKKAAIATAAIATGGFIALCVAPTAFASTNPTADLLWQMPKGATAASPQWPQILVKTVECGYVGQHDVYQTYKDEKFDKSAKDRLDAYIKDITADGKLTWSQGVSEDTDKAAKYGVKIISWDFVDGKCKPTPSPSKTSEKPTPTVTTTTPTPTATETTPATSASFYSRTCPTTPGTATGTVTIKTNVVSAIQVVASGKVNGVPLPAPTYGVLDGMNTVTFGGIPEGAVTVEVTLTAENEDAVTISIQVRAATGCSTTPPTVNPPVVVPPTVNPPVVVPPTVNPPATKATAEVLTTSHPGK